MAKNHFCQNWQIYPDPRAGSPLKQLSPDSPLLHNLSGVVDSIMTTLLCRIHDVEFHVKVSSVDSSWAIKWKLMNLLPESDESGPAFLICGCS